MNNTDINWCDKTWNPMTGCLHNCEWCYARRLAEGRLKASGVYPQGFKPVFHEKRLNYPVNKAGAVIFVGSMTDMMGEWWTAHDINAVIEICHQEPQHTFLWLSKNPGRYGDFIWPDNCYLGATITGSKIDNLAGIEAFMRTPNIKRFLSIEPMLGPVSLSRWLIKTSDCCGACIQNDGWCPACDRPAKTDAYIHQVILGPQTGPNKTHMKEEWAEHIQNECKASGVLFWRKDKTQGQLIWRKS